MLIRDRANGFEHTRPSEITSPQIYLARRRLLGLLGAGAVGQALLGNPVRAQVGAPPGKLAPLKTERSRVAGAMTMEKVTAYRDATEYNNFYEFGTSKSAPARLAHTLKPRPWTLVVDGLVKKPLRLDLDDLLSLAPIEERIYRLRCVEGWSMVIPWNGYSLSTLLNKAEPLGSAKFVEFVTTADTVMMPNVRSSALDFPYLEALRLDEAMHPLTLLTLGMYGEALPNQNGAPVRLTVPWKYGFKSGKSVVNIRLVEAQPTTTWRKVAAAEYGFFANVNPNVDHPRWSQATERRLGEDGLFSAKRKTLMFNGYEAQVGQLYAGMDLAKFY